jgi:hypothetical protein
VLQIVRFLKLPFKNISVSLILIVAKINLATKLLEIKSLAAPVSRRAALSKDSLGPLLVLSCIFITAEILKLLTRRVLILPLLSFPASEGALIAS